MMTSTTVCDKCWTVQNESPSLICAARNGHEKCLKDIIKAGGDVAKCDQLGRTALQQAVLHRKHTAVEILLQAGADVNKEFRGYTPLMTASKLDDGRSINLLITAGSNLNFQSRISKESALSIASRYGRVVSTSILLQAETNVNIRNADGTTPLLLAAFKRHWNCMSEIAKAGADLNEKDNHGFTALSYTLQNNVIEWTKLLLELGADINAPINSFNDTPLTYSLKTQKDQCIELLLERGADVNLSDKNGNTPLHFAVMKSKDNSADFVDLLLQSGANIRAENHTEFLTPLMAASIRGSKYFIRLLLQAEPNVDHMSSKGYTAFYWAIQKRNLEAAELLKRSGADVNMKFTGGFTILRHAVDMEAYSMVKWLLKSGADVNLTDDEGKTPWMMLHKALFVNTWMIFEGSSLERMSILKYMVTAGASINLGFDFSRFCFKSDKELGCLLYAAGEDLERIKHLRNVDFCIECSREFSLKNLCRGVIRKHLLKIDSKSSLFKRIRLLCLPDMVSEFLLYDVSLED